MKIKKALFGVITSLGLFAACGAHAAVDYFLEIEGIPGESTDSNHEGWINLLSVNWGVSRSVDPTSGRPTGAPVAKQLTCAKELDKSSPKLLEACVVAGTVIPTLTIQLTKEVGSAGGRATYYQYELKNVLVTSYNISGAGQSESVPMEEFSLNFEEIKVIYTEYGADGGKGGTVEATWKVEEGES